MGYASSHQKKEIMQAHCNLCGVNVIRDANQSAEIVCLICQATILHRIFQARRQRASLASEQQITPRAKGPLTLLSFWERAGASA